MSLCLVHKARCWLLSVTVTHRPSMSSCSLPVYGWGFGKPQGAGVGWFLCRLPGDWPSQKLYLCSVRTAMLHCQPLFHCWGGQRSTRGGEQEQVLPDYLTPCRTNTSPHLHSDRTRATVMSSTSIQINPSPQSCCEFSSWETRSLSSHGADSKEREHRYWSRDYRQVI